MLLGLTITLEVFATTCMKMAATTGSNLWQMGVGLGYVACFSIFPYVRKWRAAHTRLTCSTDPPR